jgi:hypothetical protein
MKLKRWAGLAGIGSAMIACGESRAAYTGISAEVHTWIVASGSTWAVYRVYANCTDPDDLVLCWGGAADDPFTIQSRNAIDTGPGTNFFNPGGSVGNTAPSLLQINGGKSTPPIINIQWGTFATIGVWLADGGSGPTPDWPHPDQTQLTPGFPTFIGNPGTSMNTLTAAGMVFAVPQALPNSQGAAGYGGDLLRVPLMQLTVGLGNNIKGEIDLVVHNAGQPAPIVVQDQCFGMFATIRCGADVALPQDNQVNVDDLLAIIQQWGECQPQPAGACDLPCASDIINTGTVDVDDLLFVINHWGGCHPSCP